MKRLSATVMAKELSALEHTEEGPEITEGDVAILEFLAASELIERDLWQQYNELGRGTAALFQTWPDKVGNAPTVLWSFRTTTLQPFKART